MYKIAARLIIALIAVCVGMIAFTPVEAHADLPDPIPAECQHYVDQRNDYLMAVIGNYQADLEYQKTQTQLWHDAHDRVAVNAVKRNYEYAAALEANRKLTDKVNWKNAKLRELRGIIRDLRSK
jgi:hypothetical protein